MTMSTLQSMMEQQKHFYRELLQQQSKNFKSCVEIISDGEHKRVDSALKQIQELNTSLEVAHGKLESQDKVLRENGKKLKQLEDLAKSVETLDRIDKKMDYLENQSRRSNIIIDGVPEEKGENWEMSEMKVQEILGKKLGLNVKDIEIERAHRVGKFDESRPRQIVVKLLRHKDKQMIQSQAKKLKGTRIYINEDYSDLIKKKRKELMPELRAAWERADSAVLRYDKLIIKPRKSS